MKLVIRRQRKLAERLAVDRRIRILPGQRVVAVAELRAVIGELHLKFLAGVRGRGVHLVGNVIHRLDQLYRIDEERAAGAQYVSLAGVMAEVDRVFPLPAAIPGRAHTQLFPLRVQVHLLQRGCQGHCARSRRREAGRKGERGAAAAGVGRQRAVPNTMRRLVVLETQLVAALLSAFGVQGARVQPEIGRIEVPVSRVFAARAHRGVADEKAAFFVEPVVLAEFGRFFRDRTGAHFHRPAEPRLELARLAFPLRGIDGCGSGALRRRRGCGQCRQHAEQKQLIRSLHVLVLCSNSLVAAARIPG